MQSALPLIALLTGVATAVSGAAIALFSLQKTREANKFALSRLADLKERSMRLFDMNDSALLMIEELGASISSDNKNENIIIAKYKEIQANNKELENIMYKAEDLRRISSAKLHDGYFADLVGQMQAMNIKIDGAIDFIQKLSVGSR